MDPRRGQASLAAAFALAAGLAAGDLRAAENLAAGELVDKTALRVCADPADLPFSNEDGQGFENAVAELMAAHFDRPLTYTWFPRSFGFVRQTLRGRLCDLVLGVVAATDILQNTNPYYHSTYVMAVREEDAARFTGLDDSLRGARLGVVAGTPPADLLARRGLAASAVPYHLHTDARHRQPLRQMMDDLAAGEIDVAFGWGPPVGYFAARASTPIALSALKSDDPRLRMAFRISMGVRWGEPDWKREVNGAIAVLQPEITRILQEFDVPLLDDDGALIEGVAESVVDSATLVATTRAVAAGGAAGDDDAAGPPPEPEGYRMSDYRGPTPATLAGGSVIADAAALEGLMRAETPILIDVFRKRRKPENQPEGSLWIEEPRIHIPGSIWLPNVGYGELSAEFAQYFEENLERLTDGDKSKALVFYCNANCWMSWNAAKRAITEHGYQNVHWYPDGVDGWEAEGRFMVEGSEVQMPDFVRE